MFDEAAADSDREPEVAKPMPSHLLRMIKPVSAEVKVAETPEKPTDESKSQTSSRAKTPSKRKLRLIESDRISPFQPDDEEGGRRQISPELRALMMKDGYLPESWMSGNIYL